MSWRLPLVPPPAASCSGISAHASALSYTSLLQVQATCTIKGQYALKSVQNWPAQMQLCGPTGGQLCSGIAYDAADPVIIPSKWVPSGGLLSWGSDPLALL